MCGILSSSEDRNQIKDTVTAEKRICFLSYDQDTHINSKLCVSTAGNLSRNQT